MPSSYYTDFKFQAVGLKDVLADFKRTANQIKAEAEKIGKIKFSVDKSALASLKAISQELKQLRTTSSTTRAELQRLGAISGLKGATGSIESLNRALTRTKIEATSVRSAATAMSASLRSVSASSATFTKVSADAGKISAALVRASSTATSLVGAIRGVATAANAISVATKAATTLAGALGAARSAAVSLGGALMTAGVAGAGLAKGAMGAAAMAAPLRGLRGVGSLGMAAAPLTLGAFGMLGVADIPIIAGAAGLYSYSGLEQQASLAAAKQGFLPGGTYYENGVKKQIATGAAGEAQVAQLNARTKQNVMQYSQELGGTGILPYTPNAIASSIEKYTAMGGDILSLNKDIPKAWLAYAGATGWEPQPALESLYSNIVMFKGEEGTRDASNWWRYANLYTSLANTTMLEPEQIQSAMKYAAPVAVNYGMEDYDLMAAYASLAQRGRIGEQGGTDIRRVLMRTTGGMKQLIQEDMLSGNLEDWSDIAPGEDVSKYVSRKLTAQNLALAKFGLDFKDINVKDVGMEGMLANLEKAGMFDGSEASQAAIKDIFGVQGLTPILDLYDAYKKGELQEFSEMYKQAAESGAEGGVAWRTQEVANDNLRGSFNKLKGSIQAAANDIGKFLEPAFRDFTDFATQEAMPAIREIGDHLSKGEWGEAAKDIGSGFDFIKDKIGGFAEKVIDQDWGGLAGGFADWALGGLKGIGSDLMNYDWSGITSGLSSALQAAGKSLRDALVNTDWASIGSYLWNGIKSNLGSLRDYLQEQIAGVSWVELGTRLGAAVREALTTAWADFSAYATTGYESILTTLALATAKFAKGAFEGFTGWNLDPTIVQIVELVNVFIKSRNTIALAWTELGLIFGYIGTSITNALSPIIGIFDGITSAINGAIASAMEFLGLDWGKGPDVGKGTSGGGIGDGIGAGGVGARSGEGITDLGDSVSIPKSLLGTMFTAWDFNVLGADVSLGFNSDRAKKQEKLRNSQSLYQNEWTNSGDTRNPNYVNPLTGSNLLNPQNPLLNFGQQTPEDTTPAAQIYNIIDQSQTPRFESDEVYWDTRYEEYIGYEKYLRRVEGADRDRFIPLSPAEVKAYNVYGDQFDLLKYREDAATQATTPRIFSTGKQTWWGAGELVTGNEFYGEASRDAYDKTHLWPLINPDDVLAALSDPEPTEEEKEIVDNTAKTADEVAELVDGLFDSGYDNPFGKLTEDMKEIFKKEIEDQAASATGTEAAGQKPGENLWEDLGPDEFRDKMEANADSMFYRSYIGSTSGYIPWLEQTGEGARRLAPMMLSQTGYSNGVGLSSGANIPSWANDYMVNQALLEVQPQVSPDAFQALVDDLSSQGYEVDMQFNPTNLKETKAEAEKDVNVAVNYHTGVTSPIPYPSVWNVAVNYIPSGSPTYYPATTNPNNSSAYVSDSDVQTGISNFLTSLPKYHSGGIVPGVEGQEVPIMAKGGERVLPSGSGNQILVNVTLPNAVITNDLVATLADKITEELQNRMDR